MSLLFLISYSQDVTVINNYGTLKPGENPEDFVLKNVTEITYIINDFEPANTGVRSSVEQMISYGLRSYIDENYHIFDGRVEAIVNKNEFMKQAASIVENALWIHDQAFADDFPGFSKEIEKRIERIIAADGYRILFDEDVQKTEYNGKLGLYTFQRMVYDLKRACELEADFFLDQVIPRGSRRNQWNGSESYLVSKEYYLTPQAGNKDSLKTDKPDLDDLFAQDDLKTDEGKDKKRRNRRSRDNQLTERVVELLEQNTAILNSYNDRFEHLQHQIDNVRAGANADIKSELSELRNMIQDLADGKGITESDGSTTKILPGEELVIIFEKNAHELTFSQKAVLNKALIVLRSQSGSSAFITGYADKTGDSDFNAWISKKRAEAVQRYMRSRGIESSRLILNFLGDAESESPNPKDRKVTVQYLINS